MLTTAIVHAFVAFVQPDFTGIQPDVACIQSNVTSLQPNITSGLQSNEPGI